MMGTTTQTAETLAAATPAAELAAVGLETPIGPLVVLAGRAGVRAVEFADRPARPGATFTGGAAGRIAADAARRLHAYFGGDLAALDPIPVDPGGSAFHQMVWSAMRGVPAGRTISYGELARRAGRPVLAARAVGRASAANPVAIVIPCHRVVGARGALTGYAGGLDRKRWLLTHEGVLVRELTAPARA
jgi:methylated-DNA-[protein]-cysteine S-methyltransferase